MLHARVWSWLASVAVGSVVFGSPIAASTPVVLDTRVPWTRGGGGWPATDNYRTQVVDDAFRVVVDEPGKGATLNYPVALHLDPQRTPIVTVTYRSEGLRLADPNKTVLAFYAGCNDALPVLHHRDMRDGEGEQTMSIDLRDVIDELGRDDEVLPYLDIRVHAGDGTGRFDVLAIRFDPDPEATGIEDAAAENTDPGTGSGASQGEAYDRAEPVQVRVVDPAGQAVTGAVVTLDPHLLNLQENAETDADGRVTLRSTTPAVTQTRRALRVTKPGFVDVWLRDLTQAEPGELRVVLAPAVELAGRVVNEAGEPVAGATGVLWIDNLPQQPRGTSPLRPRDQRVVTDDQGRWTSPPLPDAPGLSVQVRWMDDRFLQDQWGGHFSGKVSLAALRDGSATSILKRGVALTGVVTDESGQPIVDAHVAQGEDRFPSNAPPATKTDAQGQYRFDNISPGRLVLTVTAPGRAPELINTEATPGMDPIDFALRPGAVYRFRVVDAEGNPVAKAGISADTWRGFRSLAHSLHTNADGEVTWHGPHDRVQFDIYARDLMRQERTLGPNDPDDPSDVHVVIMPAPLRVTLRATDAQTGEPIESFAVVTGLRWDDNPDSPPHWQRDDRATPGRDGQWSQTYTFNYPYRFFRVEAEGYRPAVSRAIEKTEGVVTLDLQLTPAEPTAVTLVDADGNAVSGATVLLATGRSMPQLVNGRINHDRTSQRFTTDEDGRFNLPPTDEYFVLFATTDAGYLEVDNDEFAAADGTLTVQPWARLTGTLRVGDRPGTGEQVQGWFQRDYDPNRRRPHHGINAAVDADGRFEIDRVPPGQWLVGRRVQTSPNSYTSTSSQRFTAEPGRTHTLDIGGTGRPVGGAVAWPEGHEGGSLTHGHWSVRSDHNPAELRKLTEDMMPEGFEQWSAKQRIDFFKTEEGNALQDKLRAVQTDHLQQIKHYAFAVASDGSFRIDDVEPGAYVLSMQVHEPPVGNQCGFGDPIAQLEHRFTVAALPEGQTYDAEATDLGTLTLNAVTPAPGVGDAAPDFAVPLLDPAAAPDTYANDDALQDADTFRLADQRGKLVLVDFWAVWCGPCTAETPHLKAVWNQFGDDPRFTMIGLSLDREPQTPADYARKNELGWPQGFLGDWGQAQAPRDYGVRGIPSIWLIGPDGNVLAKDLRGAGMAAQVRRVLDTMPAADATASAAASPR